MFCTHERINQCHNQSGIVFWSWYQAVNVNVATQRYEKFTFFYGGIFSQWFPVNITIDGVTYNCCEQYMMAKKARTFGDFLIAAQVMDTESPYEQKALGRKVN